MEQTISINMKTEPPELEEIIAMNIGTSYSRVAVVRENGSVWISEKIPLMVSFTCSGKVLIGEIKHQTVLPETVE